MAVLDTETDRPTIRRAVSRRRRFKVTIGRRDSDPTVHRNLSSPIARQMVDSMVNVMMGGGDAAYEITSVKVEPESEDG